MDQCEFDGLRIVGAKLDANIAVLGGPAGCNAANQHGSKCFEPAHPRKRFLALTVQRFVVCGAAEERVMLGKRGLDLAVRGQCFTL